MINWESYFNTSTYLPIRLGMHALLIILCGGLWFGFNSGFKNRALKTSLLLLLIWNSLALLLTLISPFSVLIRLILPISERFGLLLSFVWLFWAYTKAAESKSETEIPAGISLILAIGAVFATVFWLPQSQQTTGFNQTGSDTVWKILAVLSALSGIVISVFKPAKAKRMGIALSVIFILMALASALFPNEGNYPLYSLAATPLLFLPAFALAMPATARSAADPIPASVSIPASVASNLVAVGLSEDEKSVYESLTHSLSLYLMADLCGLTQKTENHLYKFRSLYDLIREEYLTTEPIPAYKVPQFVNAEHSDKAWIDNNPRLSSNEKTAFLQSTSYNQSGNLLYFPISSANSKKQYSLLCATPYTEKRWSQTDLYKLKILRPKLQQILEKAQKAASRSNSSVKTDPVLVQNQAELQEQMDKANALMASMIAEKSRLLEERTQEVRLWSERQRNLEDQLSDLESKQGSVEEDPKSIQELADEKARLEAIISNNQAHLSHLKTALDSASQAMQALSHVDSSDQRVSLNHASGENEGNKFPGRSFQAEDGSALFSTVQRLELELRTNTTLFGKPGQKFSNHVGQLPEISSLELTPICRILELMQRNASKASPNNGEIRTELSMGKDEGRQSTIEIQISDEGGGLSPEELQHFLKYSSCTGHPIPIGIGDCEAFRAALKLIQSLNGHFWVQNPEQNLTCYRIAIPVRTIANGWTKEGKNETLK